MTGRAAPNRIGPTRRSLLLFIEGLAVTRTQPIVAAVTALVVAAVCAVILATVGQTAAAEARVLASVDEAGTRTIVISDPTGRAVLQADSVRAITSLTGVEWAIGLGPVDDVRNAALGSAGRPVPARRVFGDLADAVHVSGGRQAASGEAIAGPGALRVLGMVAPAGGVRSETLDASVVGAFTALAPLTMLDGSVLIPTEPESATATALRQIIVVAQSVEDIESLSRAIPAVIHVDDRSELRVETPVVLVELRSLVAKELATSSRHLVLVVLGVGLIVISVTLSGGVAQRRRDFGRRRALGASRSVLVLLVLVQTGFAAAIGVALGSAVGLVAVSRLAGSIPAPSFMAGVAILTFLTALAAAVPPALIAAYRDPVRILRVP